MDAAIALFQGKSYQAYSLPTHIYEHVPPKNGGLLPEDLDKNDKEAMKKAIRKAICHYHTDMSGNKREGMEWLILCEEITKKLNNFYEYHKG
jgi:predicted SprT family Zn-dependent metalloprotease